MNIKQTLIIIFFMMFGVGFVPKAYAYDKYECGEAMKDLKGFNRGMDEERDDIEEKVIDFYDAMEDGDAWRADEYKISITVYVESMAERHTRTPLPDVFDILYEIKDHCDADTYKLERHYIQESKRLRKFARDIKKVYDRFKASQEGRR